PGSSRPVPSARPRSALPYRSQASRPLLLGLRSSDSPPKFRSQNQKPDRRRARPASGYQDFPIPAEKTARPTPRSDGLLLAQLRELFLAQAEKLAIDRIGISAEQWRGGDRHFRAAHLDGPARHLE